MSLVAVVVRVSVCVAAQEALEQELRDEAAKGQLQLDDAAREEYNRIKQDAGAKTSKLAQDLASLQTTQKARGMFDMGKADGASADQPGLLRIGVLYCRPAHMSSLGMQHISSGHLPLVLVSLHDAHDVLHGCAGGAGGDADACGCHQRHHRANGLAR